MKTAVGHRKRHIPSGPAGTWFKMSKRRLANANANGSVLSSEQSHERAEPEEDYRNSSYIEATRIAQHVRCSAAWKGMLASKEIRCEDLSELSLSVGERYRRLRREMPRGFMMIWEVLKGDFDFKLHQVSQTLLALVGSVDSHIHHNTWTVDLQDETGASVRAWLEPQFVQEQMQQRQAQYQSIIRPGVVWEIRKPTMTAIPREDHDAPDGQGQEAERMLLISKDSVVHQWFPIKDDEHAKERLKQGLENTDKRLQEAEGRSEGEMHMTQNDENDDHPIEFSQQSAGPTACTSEISENLRKSRRYRPQHDDMREMGPEDVLRREPAVEIRLRGKRKNCSEEIPSEPQPEPRFISDPQFQSDVGSTTETAEPTTKTPLEASEKRKQRGKKTSNRSRNQEKQNDDTGRNSDVSLSGETNERRNSGTGAEGLRQFRYEEKGDLTSTTSNDSETNDKGKNTNNARKSGSGVCIDNSRSTQGVTDKGPEKNRNDVGHSQTGIEPRASKFSSVLAQFGASVTTKPTPNDTPARKTGSFFVTPGAAESATKARENRVGQNTGTPMGANITPPPNRAQPAEESPSLLTEAGKKQPRNNHTSNQFGTLFGSMDDGSDDDGDDFGAIIFSRKRTTKPAIPPTGQEEPKPSKSNRSSTDPGMVVSQSAPSSPDDEDDDDDSVTDDSSPGNGSKPNNATSLFSAANLLSFGADTMWDD